MAEISKETILSHIYTRAQIDQMIDRSIVDQCEELKIYVGEDVFIVQSTWDYQSDVRFIKAHVIEAEKQVRGRPGTIRLKVATQVYGIPFEAFTVVDAVFKVVGEHRSIQVVTYGPTSNHADIFLKKLKEAFAETKAKNSGS